MEGQKRVDQRHSKRSRQQFGGNRSSTTSTALFCATVPEIPGVKRSSNLRLKLTEIFNESQSVSAGSAMIITATNVY